jgi:hypothetical protein
MAFPGSQIIFRAYDLYEHSIDESNKREESYVMAKQPNGEFGYFNTNQFALTSSNSFTGNQTINGNLTVNGNIFANNFITSSTLLFTGSTNHGSTNADTHTFTGSVKITGSLSVIGPSTFDYIIFNSQSVAPLQSYMLQANTTDKTLDLRMGANATLQLGQELYYPPIVNKSGGNLPNGCLVMFNPADPTQGNRIAVVKCISDGTYPADFIVGILTEDVAINQEGFATWFGYVRNVSRTELESAGLKDPSETWTEGQILYPHPTRAGGLTNVQPTAPNLKSSICAITSINGVNITFLVRPHLRGTIKGLHDTIDTSINSSYGDLLMKSGSVWTNSKTLIGDYRISGSLFVSGTTEFGGDLVPKFPSGSTLGTELRPFKGIYVSSGSINIASDTPGDPNTTITNIGGNLLVSAGGMRLVDPGAFIAATGSFQYLSGSFTHIGSAFRTGDTTMVGNTNITGSLTLSSGSALRINNGFYVNGNRQFNYGQWISLQTQSGSANTAYAMKFETATGDLSGMYVGNNGSGLPTRIYVENTGLYNIQFSAQLHTIANEACDFSIWFAMTGSNMVNSNTDFTVEKISGGGFQVAALNFLTPITSGSYVELFWSKTTANGQLQAKGVQSTPTRPATPSVIVTLTQIA